VDTAIEDLAMDGKASIVTASCPARPYDFSTEELRQTRIALGEYARKVGIYDPIEVLSFTRLCIHEAGRRFDDGTLPNDSVFVARALLVASFRCGLRVPNRGTVMELNESLTESTQAVAGTPNAEAAQNFVAIVADQKPIAAVPAAHKRAMPPQPLGELPDVRPATIWSSCAQTLRRAAMSVVSSVFARSD